MPNRVQTLRSNVAGNRPTGRLPGELYVNWADGQLGIINSGSNPQDLIAVRFFSTAANYNIGDFTINSGQLYRATAAVTAGAFNPAQWTQVGGSVSVGDALPTNPQPGSLWWDSVGGQLYVYYDDGSGTQWVIANNFNGGAYLPLSGGTLTGDLTLAADPVNALDAATKEYVDATNIRYRNRITNGDMAVDQRNGGTPVTMKTTNMYAIDRWGFTNGNGTPSKGSVGQGANGAQSAAFPFPYLLSFASSGAYTPVAADSIAFYQGIEGYNFADALFGTPNAQPVVLEFCAYVGVAGTYAGSLRNGAANRSYVFTFTMTAASAWQKFRINIPGDTTGTWNVSGAGAAAYLAFNVGTGAPGAGTPNAWTAGNFTTAANAVNATASAVGGLILSQVALMVGANAQNAEPEFRKYSDNLIDCCRYFWSGAARTQSYQVTGQNIVGQTSLPAVMRASPTCTVTSNTSLNVGAPVVSSLAGLNSVQTAATTTATGMAGITITFTADADF